MTAAFKLQVAKDGTAELIFDLPGEKVNTFSLPVLTELESYLDQLASNPSIKVLKLTSGKEGVFVAGADLHSFEPVFDDPSQAETIIKAGHRVFSKLQNLPFPTVAVINGVCVGGGLEYALSCTYRVVSDHPKAKLALPEVTLGIFPGWGGTQRLPRLVGLTEALPMILTGKTVPGLKAWKMHLADALVPAGFLTSKADEFTKLILTIEGRDQVLKRRQRKSWHTSLLEDNPLGRALVFWQAKKSVLEKTKGHYPAPLIALDVIKETYTLPLQKGLQKEIELFLANIPDGFAIAKYLIALFFIQEAAKKETWVANSVKPQEVRSAAVIGAGTMGAGIGWLLADHGVLTRLKDVSWELVAKGIGMAKALFEKGLKAKKVTRSQCDRHFQLISGTVDYSGFQHAQVVIEAATENLEIKRKIFQEVEAAVKPDTVIASNTSSLTIAEMSEGLKHPDRFVAMHFFNPVQKMPLVEVVAGPKTAPEAVATAVNLCKKLEKLPMVVGDCHGFLVNRILMQGANEALFLLEEGHSMAAIEKALLDFGMPMGPFLLADEIGNDVSYKVAKTFEHAYGERMRPPKLLQLMAEHELYGRKNGKGFYLYKGGKPSGVNPAVNALIKTTAHPKAHADQEIIPRFVYGMVNEAARCLEERIISRSDYLDLSLIMGIGFPPFRGGLLRYADKEGVAQIVTTLRRFERELGPRFKPCALLDEKARSNGTFYS